jgi:dienelactone hydrolase
MDSAQPGAHGHPLPYLRNNNTADDPASVDYGSSPIAEAPRYLALLRDANAVERSTIPVEKIQGPVLLVSREDDQIWFSSVMADIAIRRLRQNAHAFLFRHLSYPDAGHGIYVPYSPTTQNVFVQPVDGTQYSLGGTPAADAEAGADAWRHVLAFLEAGARERG